MTTSSPSFQACIVWVKHSKQLCGYGINVVINKAFAGGKEKEKLFWNHSSISKLHIKRWLCVANCDHPHFPSRLCGASSFHIFQLLPRCTALLLPFITTTIHHLLSANLAALIFSNRTQCTVDRMQCQNMSHAFCWLQKKSPIWSFHAAHWGLSMFSFSHLAIHGIQFGAQAWRALLLPLGVVAIDVDHMLV